MGEGDEQRSVRPALRPSGQSWFSGPSTAHTVFPPAVGLLPQCRLNAETMARPETVWAPAAESTCRAAGLLDSSLTSAADQDHRNVGPGADVPPRAGESGPRAHCAPLEIGDVADCRGDSPVGESVCKARLRKEAPLTVCSDPWQSGQVKTEGGSTFSTSLPLARGSAMTMWFSNSRVASCDGDRRPPVDSASLGKKDPAW